MARMIKQIVTVNQSVKLSTIFEDGTQADRILKAGDIVENLRYVKDGEVIKVSGRIVDIRYTIPTSTFSSRNPSNTLVKDIKLTDLVIDTSEQYNAKSEVVPLNEVVEFEGEENVVRMLYAPEVSVGIELRYSNYSVTNVDIVPGDTFDNVRIMNPATPGIDITGKFEVLGFVYTASGGKYRITGLGLKSLDSNQTLITTFDRILALNEVYTYEIDENTSASEVISGLNDGDTVVINNNLDVTTGKALNITQKDVTIDLDSDITTDGSSTGGIRVTGSATLNGPGKIVNKTPYSNVFSSGVIGVKSDGKLTINGGGIEAVIADDPANKGQFGIVVHDNAQLTINDGDFKTGWYAISGNGSTTSANAVTVVNGGTFTSVADYAIYHPHPGKIVINGGTFKGAAGALAANNGVIEINGGDFSVLGGGNTGNWGDGTSGLADVAINLNAKYGDITCRITGGTFHATAAGTIMIATGTNHNVDLKISGGKFTSKPNAEWIAEGCTCADAVDADGYFVVSQA